MAPALERALNRHAHLGQRVASGLRPLGWRTDVLFILGLSMALANLGASSGDVQQQLIATLYGLLAGAAALCWALRDPRLRELPIGWLFGFGFVLRLISCAASPLLEDDHWRYLWDGFRTFTTGSPYGLPPSAFFGVDALDPAMAVVLNGVNHPDVPTIYGPVLQALFAAAHAIEPGALWPIKGVLLLADMAVLLVLARMGVPCHWLLAYAVHPLVLREAMVSAHPDAMVGLFLLLAAQAWRANRAIRSGLWLGVAIASKVSALVAVPFLLMPAAAWAGSRAAPATRAAWARWAMRVALACGGLVAACYGYFLLQGGSDAPALAVFSQTWRFNPLGYRLLEDALPGDWVRPTAGVLVALALAVLLHRGWSRTLWRFGLPPLDCAVLALLLLSPVVNPWYWLWALPLAIACGRVALVAAAAVSAVAYLQIGVLQAAGWAEVTDLGGHAFAVPWPVAWVQVAVPAAVAWAVWRAHRDAPHIAHRVTHEPLP